jgi:hypothetical protein
MSTNSSRTALANSVRVVLNTEVVPGQLSKLLFPSSSRSQRRRKVRAFWLWLVTGIVIIAVVAGVIYLLYVQQRR